MYKVPGGWKATKNAPVKSKKQALRQYAAYKMAEKRRKTAKTPKKKKGYE